MRTKTTCRSLAIVLSLSTLLLLATLPARAATTNAILFVTQVPMPTEINSRQITGSVVNVSSPFGNHLGDTFACARGGALWIRYQDGSITNLTLLAGYGTANGFQSTNSIAVREPHVHWNGTKALFSMVVGAPTSPSDTTKYVWQIYEITNFGQGQLPTITKVPNQPSNYNNVSPTYGTDGRIIFASDRPREGSSYLYPLREEYLQQPTVTGLWSLNPSDPNSLFLLEHSPSGSFRPFVDSFGRVIFTRWDHLARDVEAVTDRNGQSTNNVFNYSDESSGASVTTNTTEVFPEPRPSDTNALVGLNMRGNAFNQFFPWSINEDGTSEEVVNHIGRHEMLSQIPSSTFTNDPNIVTLNANQRFNTNYVSNFFPSHEDPNNPGLIYGVDCIDIGTHTAGQIVTLTAATNINADVMTISYITPKSTAFPNVNGLYRNPLPLSNGVLVAVYAPGATTNDFNTGTGTSPKSKYDFRLRTMKPSDGTFVADQFLTPGITNTVGYYVGTNGLTYTGPMWELDPVEVAARPMPQSHTTPIADVEAQVFTDLGVDLPQFQNYLKMNKLALVVSRNVTARDKADKQQPYNLKVAWSGTQTLGSPTGTVYSIGYLQMMQADQLRGFKPDGVKPAPGRRILAQPWHDDVDENPPVVGGPTGSVQLGNDGSFAAILPAQRAMSWQTVDTNGAPVVRERYWVTFQPGEIRTCANCHGINTQDQAGHVAPTNKPEALVTLLKWWKVVNLPQTPGVIAFMTQRDGDYEIYTMNPDGSNQVNLTHTNSMDVMPRISYDGSKIVFMSDRGHTGNMDIWTMNGDGSGLFNVTKTNLPGASIWGAVPNGDCSKICYMGPGTNGYNLYVVNADGTGKTNLTNDKGDGSFPYWSYDGSKIVFGSFRDNNATNSGEEVYIMNANGSGQKRLTFTNGRDFYPVISPDGSKIAFTTERDGHRQIYLMNATDGSGQTNISNNAFNDQNAYFSPDGSRISFTSDRDGNGAAEVYVMNADGSNPQRLTSNTVLEAYPAWGNTPQSSPPPPPPTFTLTVSSGSGGGSYTNGQVVSISANAPPAGQVFDQWTGATVANPLASSTTITMPGTNTTVTATYKASPPPTFTLTVNSGSGSGSYTNNQVVSITANAALAGQVFNQWTGAAIANPLTSSTTLTMPGSNTSVTATYKAAPPVTFTLTVNSGSGSGSYTNGTVVNISANASPNGQVFDQWTGANVGNSLAANTTLTMPAADTSVTANYKSASTNNIPIPVTSHPRLWITTNDLPRLRSWAVASNPIYQQGLLPQLQASINAYNTQFFPGGVANPNYPDLGDTQGYTGQLTESHAMIFALNSLIDSNPTNRVTYAQNARNLLMYAFNQAALGHQSNTPFRDPLFAVYNRANGSSEQWALAVDWIYSATDLQGNPILSAQDKLTIRNVFMMWANDCLNASTTGGDHPSPVGVTNSLSLLPGGSAYRMAANNYYLGHARLLTMMTLCIDPTDDPPVNASQPASKLGNSLRSYLADATGAWLYQEFAMYGDAATVKSAYGLAPTASVGLTSGGMPPEGWLYGHSFAYLFGQLLALHTAGYDDPQLSGPQIGLIGAPAWDRMMNGWLSSITPAAKVFSSESWLGPVYQMHSYGDLLRLYITPDFMQPMALLALLDQQTGNASRLNAERWFAVNATQGGAAALNSRMSNPFSKTEPVLYFLLLDPSAPAATDPRPNLPTAYYDAPKGRLIARTDWSANASVFDFHSPWISINHQQADGGSFEFYRKGEWLTKEASNYDNNSNGQSSIWQNTLALQNWCPNGTPNLSWFETPLWLNGSQWQLGLNAGDPVTITSTGTKYAFAQTDMTKLYNRPGSQWVSGDNATDIQHASRSALWVNGDYIVVYDRAASLHPNLFKRFNLDFVATPTINGNLLTETTAGGQKLYVQSLLPANATMSIVPFDTNAVTQFAELEPTRCRAIIQDTTNPTDVRFLNVLQGADSATPVDAAALVQSSAGNAFQGAAFGGMVVMFPVTLSNAFASVTYTAPAGITNHYVTGLAPGTGYSVAQQGGQFTVTPGGSFVTDSAGVLFFNAASGPPPTFALTVNSGTGSGTCASGTVVAITANAAPAGQVFDQWTGASVADPFATSTTLTMPAGNVTVMATYKAVPIPTYTLTVNSGSGGGTYTNGQVVSITANSPSAGQVFSQWNGAAVANPTASSTTLVMPASNTTVTATYVAAPPPTFTLTVNSGSGSGSYTNGQVVGITANAPSAGQVFNQWTGAMVANPLAASTTLAMPGSSTTVTATYKNAETPKYTLTVVNGSGSGSYTNGAVIPIVANPPPTGQVFYVWYGATVANSNAPSTTLTMPATNKTVYATYKGSPGTLQFSSTSYSVNENGGSILITVTRANGSLGAVGVSYTTLDQTAKTGSDYTQKSGTLTWTNGDISPKGFTITILNDSLVEGTETFGLMLGAPTGGATIGSPSTATVSILDTTVPPQPSTNGVIVFQTSRNGANEVYSMSPDGSNLKNLTQNSAQDAMPMISKDGTKVVFDSDRGHANSSDIWTMNSDGSGLFNVTKTNLSGAVVWAPSLSPDNSKIVYMGPGVTGYNLWLVNADGSNPKMLTQTAGSDTFPNWSPDGSKIVFSSFRDDNTAEEVYVMDANGTNVVRLTTSPGRDMYAVFSPDGTKIAFTSERDGNREIYLMHADGTGQTNLTKNAAVDQTPSFSPDGTKIAFTSNRNGNWEIYTMNLDGTVVTRITNNSAVDVLPSWGPSPAPTKQNAVKSALHTPELIETAASEKPVANGGTWTIQAPSFDIGFCPGGARKGKVVTIVGVNFTGVSEVLFNGVPAKFSVKSDMMILTKVPKVATTGPIMLVGPGGTTSSMENFVVGP